MQHIYVVKNLGMKYGEKGSLAVLAFVWGLIILVVDNDFAQDCSCSFFHLRGVRRKIM
jgi:hypothetical protein